MFRKFFGRSEVPLTNSAPGRQERNPPSFTEASGPVELPKLVIKHLPLDVEALARIGPPSALHPPVRPARIVEAVPEDYEGDLYFRIFPLDPYGAWSPKRYVALPQKGRLEDQPGQRLASCWASHVAQGQDPAIFVSPGELRADMRSPLPGSLMAAAKQPFPEYTRDNWPLVSARFRRVLEELEPGRHLFIPIDLADGSEAPQLYVFFVGAIFRPLALANQANDLKATLLPGGGVNLHDMNPANRPFYYLNSGVVGTSQVFIDHWLGPIFSKRAVELLGDFLPRRYALMPMGVCDEPLLPGTSRYTRDGAVHPLT